MMNMGDQYDQSYSFDMARLRCRVDDVERQLLGLLIRRPEWISRLDLKPGHWGDALHRELWLVLREMDRRRFDIDCYTVGLMLSRRPLGLDPFMPWMLTAANDGWFSGLVRPWVRLVRNAGKKRHVVRLLQEGLDEVIGMTEFPPGVTPRQWVVLRLGGHDGGTAEQQRGGGVRAAGDHPQGHREAGAATGRVPVQVGGQVRR